MKNTASEKKYTLDKINAIKQSTKKSGQSEGQISGFYKLIHLENSFTKQNNRTKSVLLLRYTM